MNKLVAYLFFASMILASCSPKQDDKKRHSLTFSKQVDSLLNDTVSAGSVIDSLRKEIKNAENNKMAIDVLNELAYQWKGAPIKILSNEAYTLSGKQKYEYGRIDALSKQGYALYWNYLDDSAAAVYNRAITQAGRIGNKKLEAQIALYLGDIYRVHSEHEIAKKYYKRSLALAEQIKEDRIASITLSVMADLKRIQGELDSALYFYERAHTLTLKLHDIKLQAFCEAYTGDIYRLQGKQVDALNQIRGALILAKKVKDLNLMSMCYSSFGTLYKDLEELDSAFNNFSKALDICTKRNDFVNVIANLHELGNYYFYKGKIEEGVKYYRRELAVAKATNQRMAMVNALNALCDYHRDLTRNSDSARILNDEAYRLAKETNFKAGLIRVFTTRTYEAYNHKNYADAVNNGMQVLELCIETRDFKQQVEALRILTKSFSDWGKYKEAFFANSKREILIDSLRSKEEIKKFAATEYKFIERSLKEKHDQKEKLNKAQQAKKDEEIRRQQFMRNTFILGFVIIAFFSISLFRSLRQNKKQKAIIQHQKEEVEEKQKEVMDSIRYAQRIQKALLPSQKYMDKVFKKLRSDK